MDEKARQIIKKNVLTYFNLIFVVIAVLLIMVGSFRDLTFMMVVILNTAIGVGQEIHAQKVLDRLAILNQRKATVIRGGGEVKIPLEELTIQDRLVLSAGDQIPADGKVTTGELFVNESLVTGESDEVHKKPGDSLLSGSFVVSGRCEAALTAVGEDSYIAQLTARAAKAREGEQSEMIRCLNRLIRFVGIVIIPIGALLFVQQYYFSGATVKDSVTGMAAALIGMIPSGLYLLTSVALAVSTARLAGQQVLIHDMKCIEALARVDVLCVDKTGTITSPEMSVEEVIPLDGADAGKTEGLLKDFAAAFFADNATMAAVKKKFGWEGGRKAEDKLSFSPETKFSGAVFDGEVYLLGAPEMLLKETIDRYDDQIREKAGAGCRLLIFGRYDGPLEKKPLEKPVEPLALVVLKNPIRSNAVDTFRYFAGNGVEIKVISGDNPVTVSGVAAEAGIAGADNYIDASTLKTREELEQAAARYTVFGRVVPEQKLWLVQELKRQGRTVAMTGDGVNDVLALKEADCSVAMASGSDAAAQAAQLVLLDSDFARMPAVVREGRRVVNNIERSSSLFLVKNIFSILMALISLIFMQEYPMEPSQISLLGLFTIGTPAFILSLENSTEQIKGHFLRNVLLKALPAALADVLLVGGYVYASGVFGLDGAGISTACTILMSLIGFEALYHISKPMTKTHWLVLLGMIGGWLFCMCFLPPLFAIERMSVECVILLGLFVMLAEPVMRYLRTFFLWLEEEIIKNKKEKTFMKIVRTELSRASVISVILGAFLFIWPDASVKLVGYGLGGVILVFGAARIVTELLKKDSKGGAGLVGGFILFLIGVFICLKFPVLISFLPFVFGIIVLISGVIKLQGALEAKRGGYYWIPELAAAVLSIGLGILVICNPFSTLSLTLRVIGAVLFVDGAANLIEALVIRRRMKDQGYLAREGKDGIIDIVTEDKE